MQKEKKKKRFLSGMALVQIKNVSRSSLRCRAYIMRPDVHVSVSVSLYSVSLAPLVCHCLSILVSPSLLVLLCLFLVLSPCFWISRFFIFPWLSMLLIFLASLAIRYEINWSREMRYCYCYCGVPLYQLLSSSIWEFPLCPNS